MLLVKSAMYRPNLYFDVKFKHTIDEGIEGEIAKFIKKVLYQSGTLAEPNGSVLVFTVTVNDVDELAGKLKMRGLKVFAYHSKKSQKVGKDHELWNSVFYF